MRVLPTPLAPLPKGKGERDRVLCPADASVLTIDPPRQEEFPLPLGRGTGGRSVSLLTILTYTFAVCAGIGFAAADVLRHRAFHSAANDLAFFDQIVWNTAHGRFFQTSFVPYNFLGQHVQPVLLIYALLYHLWASPELLLVTQGAVAAAAAIPLYHLARRLLRDDGRACLVAALYLLSPYLHHAVTFDFHPETMAPFFAFLGYGLILNSRTRAAIWATLPILLLKEDTVLLVLGIAWLCWLRRERRAAVTLAGIATCWGALTTLIIMPHFRAGPSDLEDRYGYLGSGAANILIGLVTHPQRALAHLLLWSTLVTLLLLLGSVGFLPLAAPAELLAAIPVLCFHLLSTHAAQNSLRLHYSAEALPLVWIAAVAGLENLTPCSPSVTPAWEGGTRARRFWTSVHSRGFPSASERGGILWADGGRFISLTLCALIALVVASPLPPARGFDPGRFTVDAAHRQAITAAVAQIPPGASVSAQTGLAPHLAHRAALSEFPDGIGADYILLDARGDIAHSYQASYPTAVVALPNAGYTPIWSRDGVTLYQKN
jgi:uncharacterized membrane protein